jgi:nitroreductase
MTPNTDIHEEKSFFPGRLDLRTPINELLSRRWSPRAFSDRPVEPPKLVRLFEAARWSPSSVNDQPWRFVVATKEDAGTYAHLFSLLSESNRRWASRAPVLVLGLTRTTFSRNGRPNRHSFYDLGQAVAFLSVEAEGLGLAVHQMGGFDEERANGLLAIPPDYEPVIILAIGYTDRPESLPDDLRQREMTPRSRQPLESIVFTDAWEKPSRHVDPHVTRLSDHPSTN